MKFNKFISIYHLFIFWVSSLAGFIITSIIANFDYSTTESWVLGLMLLDVSVGLVSFSLLYAGIFNAFVKHKQRKLALTLVICSIIVGGIFIGLFYFLETMGNRIASFETIAPTKNFLTDIQRIHGSITADEVVRLTNEQRKVNGIPELQNIDRIASAALLKADHMCLNHYWSHIAPDGTEPWYFFQKTGLQYFTAGENLGRDFQSAAALVDSWMESKTHKDNILNPSYSEIGVAVRDCELDGYKTKLVVQFFMSPLSDQPVYIANKEIQQNAYVNPNTPVHCPIDINCGGGTTPLKYWECQQSTCCAVGNTWVFYKDKQQCLDDQKKNPNTQPIVDTNKDPNEPVHCPISDKCGGGTTPLKYIECVNSTCCQIGDKWTFYKDRNKCTEDQRK